MQRSAKEGKVSQFFCLASFLTIRIIENGLPIKILHKAAPNG